jgi:hypothetical protein
MFNHIAKWCHCKIITYGVEAQFRGWSFDGNGNKDRAIANELQAFSP